MGPYRGGGPAAPGVRRQWAAGGGRVRHADVGQRQHQRAGHNDRREGRGHDQGNVAEHGMTVVFWCGVCVWGGEGGYRCFYIPTVRAQKPCYLFVYFIIDNRDCDEVTHNFSAESIFCTERLHACGTRLFEL